MAAAPEGRHEVATDEEGLRLDAWLVRRALATSAAAARRLIADGAVRVEGRGARKGEPVRAGDVITCAAPEDFVILPEAEAPLEVLFVDEHLVAVAKPAGVPVHPLRAGETGTLAAALIGRFPECARASSDPREGGFAHRLDTGTSGAIVAARNHSVYLRLREALAAGLSEKRYLAEVVGLVDEARVVVDVAIGRQGRRGDKVLLGHGRGLLPARTEVVLVERRAATSLIEARIAAGRAHQVRAHLAHLGHPIVGDRLYGADSGDSPTGSGFRLHAHELRFAHPVTGAPLIIAAPVPGWAQPNR